MLSIFVDGMCIGMCNDQYEGIAIGRTYCFNVAGRHGQKIEVRDKNGIPKASTYAN